MRTFGSSWRDPIAGIIALLLATNFLVFLRLVPDSFDLPKAVLALIFGALTLSIFSLTRRISIQRDVFTVALGLAVVAVVLAALNNPHSQLAWIGQEARFTGAAFWLVAMGVSFVVYSTGDIDWPKVIMNTIFVTGIPFACYGTLQIVGRDPFDWNIVSFSARTVFSTAGNPNYAAIFAAIFVVSAASKVMSFSTSWQRIIASIVLGVNWAICAFANSVQGLLAVAAFAGGLLVVSISRRTDRLSDSVQPMSVILLSGSLLALLGSLSTPQTWILAAGISLMSVVAAELPRLPRVVGSKAYLSLLAVAVFLVAGLAGRISRFFESNLGERAAFYRAGGGMFVDSPIIGHGFERYGRLFPRFRPQWHALELETSLTGSAHSIWLGLAVSGGILLVIPFLIVAFLGMKGALSSMREMISSRQNINVEEICFSLLVFLMFFFWLVAVEQITVILFGLIVFAAATKRSSVSRRVSAKGSLGRVSIVAVTCALTVSLITFSARWFSGNRALSSAYQSIFERQDLVEGLQNFDKAIRLGPMSDQAKLRRLAIVSQLGPTYGEMVKADALAVAESYEYLGPIGISAAENLLQIGAREEAELVVRQTLENNPYATGVMAQGSSILDRLGK